MKLIILPTQYKGPIKMIMSYPPKIRKRVEELPQYKDSIQKREKAHIDKKIFGIVFFIIVFSAVAYFSGCRDFNSTFFHVLILFLVVNLFDLFVLDMGIFCHSRKLRIPGTEDMEKEYKDYFFSCKRCFYRNTFRSCDCISVCGDYKNNFIKKRKTYVATEYL